MRRMIGLLAAVMAVGLCCVGSAQAAGTYKLCSTGAGKPVVSPASTGNCAAGQKTMVLASGAALSSLKSQVSSLKAKLAGVTRSGRTLRFTHMNLQIVSGSGKTNGPVNGLGNLIIGYNEHPRTQTGSHNLVLGNTQKFTSYGGIIAGTLNSLSGPFSAMLGAVNTASGYASSVAGGQNNFASKDFASVSGGDGNTASGFASSVSGGDGNTASGFASSISGGFDNTASGRWSSILGGSGKSVSTEAGTSYVGP